MLSSVCLEECVCDEIQALGDHETTGPWDRYVKGPPHPSDIKATLAVVSFIGILSLCGGFVYLCRSFIDRRTRNANSHFRQGLWSMGPLTTCPPGLLSSPSMATAGIVVLQSFLIILHKFHVLFITL